MAILGIDEVGRGPWAGPLVMGAVILEDATADWCALLTDSKKLSAKKRQLLSSEIITKAAASALGWVSSGELDQLGMSAALRLATRRAVAAIQSQKVPFSEIIIDGPVNFLSGTALEKYVTTINKADLLIKEVSAASIIAKVARDHYMAELAELYPGYGFENHMGYGTASHQAALRFLGPCPEHRRLVRPVKALASAEETTTDIGRRAEEVTAEHLANSGHIIVARNHKTKLYEIDIVSLKDHYVYFTEVKYRKNKFHGSAAAMVDKRKLEQMRFAAESFLHYRRDLAAYDPLLSVAAVSGKDFTLEDWFPLDC